MGLALIAVGVDRPDFWIFLSPESLKQVFYFLDHLTYVGVFYVIYSPGKHKRIIVPSVICTDDCSGAGDGYVWRTHIYNWPVSLILILLGKKISFGRKLVVAFAEHYFNYYSFNQ